ncbi:SDR family oxidoreductase [uncultured Phycicoccus sp.]|uniref:SDR family oxidoreductase n=1 Tax=uncultured Phycicoccus sp. TaxID=661422 RepID=UPI0026092DEB|nr:3-beta hydroxysteroid dehydrogenase [uncultured Phycicoccus sp.]
MRVVVLGGAGEMGARVASLLEASGDDVVRASRSSGVDVTTGAGLDEALAGADVVVDCVNRMTMSRARSVGFFGSAARRVAAAAATAGVGHLVVLSIVNVTDPAVRRAAGYYAGKAAQEATYVAADVPVTVVRTTAWFTLAETFLGQLRAGPLAVVPRIGLQPVHPDAAAGLLAEVVRSGPPTGPASRDGVATRELAGPERTDAVAMARAVAQARHPGVRVVGVPAPTAGLRTGLLPGPEVPLDGRRFADWLTDSGR